MNGLLNSVIYCHIVSFVVARSDHIIYWRFESIYLLSIHSLPLVFIWVAVEQTGLNWYIEIENQYNLLKLKSWSE